MLERYSEKGLFREGSATTIERITAVPREYAEYKNRRWLFHRRRTIYCEDSNERLARAGFDQ
jgi:hypothetical protein